jgi:hypothetical protein
MWPEIARRKQKRAGEDARSGLLQTKHQELANARGPPRSRDAGESAFCRE